MAQMKSQQDFYDIYVTELQTNAPQLTDLIEGSINDVLAGVVSSAAREVELLIIDEFRKTYIDTADGPEITLGPDYLQILLVDHFGDSFARPEASFSLGEVTFSRPTAAAGSTLIVAGSIVKTQPDSSGVVQRFATLIDETMGVGVLTLNASVKAAVAGADGNVDIGKVNTIETALTDNTITVTNSAKFSAGAPALNDAQYREFARNKIQTLKGATLAAIQATALTVPGVVNATPIENQRAVIEWDIAMSAPKVGASYFLIPYSVLYIADANGTASQPLLDAVKLKVDETRAAGVRIDILAAVALVLNWTATITLNPGGPNYTELSANTQKIRDTMAQHIRDLPIGGSFVRTAANATILAIWGPAGTGDLVSGGFQTTVPTGNVSTNPNQKLIPGAVVTN